jgi:hypothetical protein
VTVFDDQGQTQGVDAGILIGFLFVVGGDLQRLDRTV